MITFRQKEYSSLGTKISLGLENTKELIRKRKIKNLKKVADNNSEENKIKSRAAKIELKKEERSPERSKIQIKRDSISTRNNIKAAIKNPKRIVRKAGQVADKTIQMAIKRPQTALGGPIGGVAIPAAISAINPVAGVVTASLPLGTILSSAPLPSNVTRKLNTVARKYRGTNFSKKLGGRK